MSEPATMNDRGAPWWLVVLCAAMAGGLGWGIRGQYGHETGAMIAGLLVGLSLVATLRIQCDSLLAARAVAMCALGISIGGSMTYGQTVGLTHDPELIGNVPALRWGLIGLFVKGGVWIGLAAAFLAMALSQVRYRTGELALLLLVMVFLLFLGMGLLNEPFDPENRLLPDIYFSDDWHWEPHEDLEPRRERWGGLLAALAGLYLYAGWIRGDRLVRRLTLWGVLAGGVGFAAGQSLQAFHAWNIDAFSRGSFAAWDPHINWWNMMETAFGAVFGGILAIGLWLNRQLICPADEHSVELSPAAEILLLGVHVAALAVWNFGSFRYFDFFADLAVTMVIVPVIAVSVGRWWPYLMALPVVALPIAGKTLRQLGYVEEQVRLDVGWIVYFVLPLLVTTAAASLLARTAHKPGGGTRFACIALLLAVWLYFGLNFAFFHFPWPWGDWTYRTPSALIFFLCAIGLTAAAVYRYVADSDDA